MKDTYSAVQRYERNTQGRDFVVGDVHGCFSQLSEALALRGYDASRDRLFAVGDLVDRGAESASLMQAVEQLHIRSVRGNHEEAIIRWHNGEENAASMLANGSEWLLDMVDDAHSVNRIVAYMASLPFVIEIDTAYGTVGIVHADVPAPDWGTMVREVERESAGGPTRTKVIWSRSRWKQRTAQPVRQRSSFLSVFGAGKVKPARPGAQTSFVDGVIAVIAGHTPMTRTSVRENVINIDTGAVYGGPLTLLDLADVPALLAGTVHSTLADTAEIDEPRRDVPELACEESEPAAAFSEKVGFAPMYGRNDIRLTVRMSAVGIAGGPVRPTGAA